MENNLFWLQRTKTWRINKNEHIEDRSLKEKEIPSNSFSNPLMIPISEDMLSDIDNILEKYLENLAQFPIFKMIHIEFYRNGKKISLILDFYLKGIKFHNFTQSKEKMKILFNKSD